MRVIAFERTALNDYIYWQTTDRKILKKVNDLLNDIERHPFTGIGKPEPLKGSPTGEWSRRITKMHRITYYVAGDTVTITRMRGHYPAK